MRSPPARRLTPLLAPALALAALLLGLVQPARAADPAQADRARRTRAAEALATEAKALFRNKAYDAAARQFMEAYATIKRATLVYNAARAREEGRQLKRAESLFLMYLSLPDASAQGKKDAKAHLARIRAALAKQAAAPPKGSPPAKPPGAKPKPAPAAPPTTGPPLVHRAQTPRLPWLLTGALALGAGVTWGVAWSKASKLSLDEVETSADAEAYKADRDGATRLRAVSIGLGVAAAAAAGWSVWTLMRVGERTSLAPVIAGPRHVGVALRF